MKKIIKKLFKGLKLRKAPYELDIEKNGYLVVITFKYSFMNRDAYFYPSLQFSSLKEAKEYVDEEIPKSKQEDVLIFKAVV